MAAMRYTILSWILNLCLVQCTAQTGAGIVTPTHGQSLLERYANWPEVYMLHQQQALFSPTLTPFGWQENPAVTSLKEQLMRPRKPTMAEEVAQRQQQAAFPPQPADPNATNASRNPWNTQALRNPNDELRELAANLNAVATVNDRMDRSGYYATQAYKEDLQRYQAAFNQLQDMLEGRAALSIADARYIVESAYGGLPMDHQAYKAEIDRSANFIRQWMHENGMDGRNPDAVNLAIQKFMGDSLTIRNGKGMDRSRTAGLPTMHVPFKYDYIDCRAVEDLHNHFLTKTLATGTGQCLTLPYVYLVLAEALGVEAHLSFMPQHAFIKYRNSKGVMENYETTVDWHMSDNEYMERMPVMSSALAKGIYLQPLSREQTVASMMIDLADCYYREHWVADGAFMEQCIDHAMPWFKNGEGNREGLLLRNLVRASQLDRVLQKQGIVDLGQIAGTRRRNAHTALSARARIVYPSSASRIFRKRCTMSCWKSMMRGGDYNKPKE